MSQPGQSLTDVVVSTTDVAGVIGTAGLDFSFDATELRIINNKLETVYVNLNSTAGSTSGYPVLTTSSLTFSRGSPSVMKMSLASTSTSTGTTVRVAAWG